MGKNLHNKAALDNIPHAAPLLFLASPHVPLGKETDLSFWNINLKAALNPIQEQFPKELSH